MLINNFMTIIFSASINIIAKISLYNNTSHFIIYKVNIEFKSCIKYTFICIYKFY